MYKCKHNNLNITKVNQTCFPCFPWAVTDFLCFFFSKPWSCQVERISTFTKISLFKWDWGGCSPPSHSKMMIDPTHLWWALEVLSKAFFEPIKSCGAAGPRSKESLIDCSKVEALGGIVDDEEVAKAQLLGADFFGSTKKSHRKTKILERKNTTHPYWILKMKLNSFFFS